MKYVYSTSNLKKVFAILVPRSMMDTTLV